MNGTVFRRGAAIGTFSVEDDGLYRVVRASIAMSRALLRLYFPDGRTIGVFAPEGAMLTCCRRLSRASLPELPQYAVAWCSADGQWEQAGDELRRYTATGIERAAAWRTDAPMDFPAAPGKLKPVRIGEEIHLYVSEPYQ